MQRQTPHLPGSPFSISRIKKVVQRTMLRRLEPQRIVAQHASRISSLAAACSQTSSFGTFSKRISQSYRLPQFQRCWLGSQHATCAGFEDVPEDEKAGRVGKVFGGVANSYDLMNDLMSGGMHRLWKSRWPTLVGERYTRFKRNGSKSCQCSSYKLLQNRCQAAGLPWNAASGCCWRHR